LYIVVSRVSPSESVNRVTFIFISYYKMYFVKQPWHFMESQQLLVYMVEFMHETNITIPI